ncbi:MAG TPA: hypothetical protein PKL31_12360 [Fulvivirga sp.]|nr:hypothetical protein [Fulvivirga sp.]
MNKLLISYSYLMALLLFSGCSSSDDNTPIITQEGNFMIVDSEKYYFDNEYTVLTKIKFESFANKLSYYGDSGKDKFIVEVINFPQDLTSDNSIKEAVYPCHTDQIFEQSDCVEKVLGKECKFSYVTFLHFIDKSSLSYEANIIPESTVEITEIDTVNFIYSMKINAIVANILPNKDTVSYKIQADFQNLSYIIDK